MRPSRGMGDINPKKDPGRTIQRKDAGEPVEVFAKGGWIAGAIKKPGALHAELGVPQGQKIPAKKLAKAAKAGGKLGARARLAETLRGFR